MWIPALKAARLLAYMRIHDLRHTAVALLIDQGAHPKAIQKQLGHASITRRSTPTGTYSPTSSRSSRRGWTKPRAAVGDAAEVPKPYTPEWTVLFAAGIDERAPERRPDIVVANYLTNVRDGLMDATGAFHDFNDD